VLVLGHSSEFMELKSIVQNDKNYNLKQGNMALISRAYNEFQFLNFFSIRKFMLRLKGSTDSRYSSGRMYYIIF
jgi:hypothetical protein